MRKAFTIFGIVCAVVVVLAAIGFGWLVARGHSLNRDGKAYADKAIVAIISDWNEQALLERGSPEFMRATANGGLDSFFMQCRRLGPMTDFHGAHGFSIFMYTGRVTAAYTAEANFRHGKAEIRISIIKRDGHWKILGFRVDKVKFFTGSSLSLYDERYRAAA